jgi:hypothetical protein
MKRSGYAKLPRRQTPIARARQLAVSFGAAIDAYRDYQIREGKEIERSRSLIENIEAFIGRGRDVDAVDYTAYQAR